MTSFVGRSLLSSTLIVSASFPALAQDSANMTLLGNQATHEFWTADIWGYDSGGTEIAIVGTYDGVGFYDVTNPAAITEVLYMPGVETIWRDIKTYQNYAYVVNDFSGADEGEGIRVFDMTDPLNPVHVRDVTDRFRATHNVWIDVDQGLLFATDTETHVYDLTADPSNPTWVYTFDEYYIHDMYSRDGVAYMAAIFDGQLATVDISDIPNSMPTMSSEFSDDDFTHNVWLDASGDYALTTDERSGGHISVFDVTNPSSIANVASWVNVDAPDAIIHNVAVRGTVAYAAWYTDGVLAFDVSDPLNITRVGYYDTFPANDDSGFAGAWGVYLGAPSGAIYASDINTGLYVFQLGGLVGTPDVTGDAAGGATPQLAAGAANPFRTQAVVQLALERATRGRLEVFDARGRFVTRLADRVFDAGEHRITWDATDARGRATAPGVYHVRLDTPTSSSSMKLVRTR